MPRRVLVIGAGCSGLVAIKECREEGLDVVCLEAQPWIGGLWRFTETESHSSVYRYGPRDTARAGRLPARTEPPAGSPARPRRAARRSTVINTSKEMMNYSDFLIPKEFPPFMHNTHVRARFRARRSCARARG